MAFGEASERNARGYCRMMGTIVLSMLLGWLGVVVALTFLSRESDESHTEPAVEDTVRVTGAPLLTGEDAAPTLKM